MIQSTWNHTHDLIDQEFPHNIMKFKYNNDVILTYIQLLHLGQIKKPAYENSLVQNFGEEKLKKLSANHCDMFYN